MRLYFFNWSELSRLINGLIVSSSSRRGAGGGE